MAKYALSTISFASPTTTADTAISIECDSAPAEVVELIMTGSGTDAAADTQHTADARYCDFASTGTATSTTPEPMASHVAAAAANGDIVYTAEATNINAVGVVTFGFNQRGGMRWAVPRGDGVVVVNALTEDGLVWTVVAQAAGAVDATMQWWE